MIKNGKNVVFIDHTDSSIKRIDADLRKNKPLTTKEEYELWDRIKNGDKKAFDRLVDSNLRYVMSVAKKYLASKESIEDLYQAGCLGLVKAAHKFDASLGFHFISFAKYYVENEIRKLAYGHINHKSISLDAPIDADNIEGPTLIDFMANSDSPLPDWDVRYDEALHGLMERADKRNGGMGQLTEKYHEMLQEGYAKTDFARRYHLNEQQMNRFLTILREESGLPLKTAA